VTKEVPAISNGKRGLKFSSGPGVTIPMYPKPFRRFSAILAYSAPSDSMAPVCQYAHAATRTVKLAASNRVSTIQRRWGRSFMTVVTYLVFTVESAKSSVDIKIPIILRASVFKLLLFRASAKSCPTVPLAAAFGSAQYGYNGHVQYLAQ